MVKRRKLKSWKKARNNKHLLSCAKRKLRHKRKRKIRNCLDLGVNKVFRTERNAKWEYRKKTSDFKWVTAPSFFSLTNNSEETIDFLNKLDVCYKNNTKVFVNLQKVHKIGHGAIVLLLSKMVQFKSNNIQFNGNLPKDLKIREILNESGFFKNLYKDFDIQDNYDLSLEKNSIYTHAQKFVNPELSEAIIKNASLSVWKEEMRCLGLQRVFLELMQNTNNHASNLHGEKHWWVSVNYNSDKNKVCFSFIDFGVGIFESLANKNNSSKFYNVLDKLKKVVRFQDNSDVLKLLLNGQVHQTATGKYYRGKGLPGVFEANQKNHISNLIIISNDAYANPSKDDYKKLNKSLNGAFIYWELTDTNRCVK